MKRKYSEKSWTDPRVEIKSSLLHGKGVFAVAQIRKGEVAVVWGLENS